MPVIVSEISVGLKPHSAGRVIAEGRRCQNDRAWLIVERNKALEPDGVAAIGARRELHVPPPLPLRPQSPGSPPACPRLASATARKT